MQCGMFHTAVVPVYRHPVIQCFLRSQTSIILRVTVTQIIPGRTSPLRHSIGFPSCRATAIGASGLNKAFHSCQRTFTVIRRHIAFYIRQSQRQFTFRQTYCTALRTMYNRNGFPPIPLTGEYPVPQLIVDFADTLSGFFQPTLHLFLCFFYGQSIQESTVGHDAGCAIGKGFFGNIAALNNFNNRQVENFCKIIVSGIVRRNRHNRTSSIAHQNIVRNKDWNFLVINRIDTTNALQLHTGFFLCHFGTLKIGLSRRFFLISTDFIHILQLICPLFNQRMLRRNNHIGGTK